MVFDFIFTLIGYKQDKQNISTEIFALWNALQHSSTFCFFQRLPLLLHVHKTIFNLDTAQELRSHDGVRQRHFSRTVAVTMRGKPCVRTVSGGRLTIALIGVEVGVVVSKQRAEPPFLRTLSDILRQIS